MSRHSRSRVASGAVAALVTNRRKPDAGTQSWYRFGNKRTVRNADKVETNTEVWIYDEIGMWGVSASDFAQELAQVDTDTVTLRLNSPGGEVYDGIAIMNAIMSHPAHVTVNVDGLAASIASVIAMAGDKVVMGAHSEMMIHDASTIGIGNASDLRGVADMLDRVSNNIAQVYAERAGGKPADWRELMLAETWMSASEAVTAGLADEVAPKPKERTGEDADPEDEPLTEDIRRRTLARWDLSNFTYAGRSQAPPPALDSVEPVATDPEPAPVVLEPEPRLPSSTEPDEGGFLIPDDFNLAEMFGASVASAMDEPLPYDPGIFHEAVALITNAPVPDRVPEPVVVPAPVAQAFPVDVDPPVVADPATAGVDPDVFRAAMSLAVYDAPAVTQPPVVTSTPDLSDYAVIDPTEFYNSLKEAIYK